MADEPRYVNTKPYIIGFFIFVVLLLLGIRVFYFDEQGNQAVLMEVPCEGMQETYFELQGELVPVSDNLTCDIMRTIGTMETLDVSYENNEQDPWHYYGRMRIRPVDDLWFLVFIARESDDYKPMFSLHHRRGNGWSIIGQFDAVPILEKLGVADSLDMQKLKAIEAQSPVNQYQPEFLNP